MDPRYSTWIPGSLTWNTWGSIKSLEFLKSYLRNRHVYACKQGYLEDSTNQIQDKEEDEDPCDDAESHDESRSCRGSGNNNDLGGSEDNEWHRSAGWGSVGKDDDLDKMYASDSVDDMEV